MIELHIQAGEDREKLVMALVNSGYTVRLEERPDPKRYLGKLYFVLIDEPVVNVDRTPVKELIQTATTRSGHIDAMKVTTATNRNGKCPNEGHPCYCTGACMR